MEDALYVRGHTGSVFLTTLIRFTQHADEHRPKRPVLLAVDASVALHRRLAVKARLPVRLVADQLLVRTGEMTRRQSGGPNGAGSEGHREILGAIARYLPALSGMCLL